MFCTGLGRKKSYHIGDWKEDFIRFIFLIDLIKKHTGALIWEISSMQTK